MKTGTWGCVIVAVFALAAGSAVRADVVERTFTDTTGRTLKAKLISHKGDGKVNLEIKGKQYSLPITKFCLDDQEFLQKWIKVNPPTLNYAFKYEIKAEKLSSDRSNSGYVKTRRARYAYKVAVINASRDVVSDLTMKYQMFLHNETSGYYYSSRGSSTSFKQGEFELPGQMPFNFKREFVTEAFQLDEVKYGATNSYRRKDELAGIIVRIYDKKGKLVDEHRFGKYIDGFTWKKPRKGSSRSSSSRRSSDG